MQPAFTYFAWNDVEIRIFRIYADNIDEAILKGHDRLRKQNGWQSFNADRMPNWQCVPGDLIIRPTELD